MFYGVKVYSYGVNGNTGGPCLLQQVCFVSECNKGILSMGVAFVTERN